MDSSDIELISRWLAAFGQLDHQAMADCYHEQATFSDIAFQLQGKKQIHAMWHIIHDSKVKVEVVAPPQTIGDQVVAKIIDRYVLSSTNRPIVNPITCFFRIRNGLILEHRDECDPKEWARQAYGGFTGWLLGRVAPLRRMGAKKKIRDFIEKHPEYK